MKKFLPLIIGVVVVLGGVGAYLLTKGTDGDKKADSTVTGSSDKTNDNAKYSDACKIFSKEDLAAALGGTYGDGQEDISVRSSDGLEGSACKYEQDNDGTTAGMTQALGVSISIDNYKDSGSASAFMHNLHDPQTADGQAAVNKPVDVSGVGDQAFFVKLSAAAGIEDKTETLYARSGKQIIVITATRLAGVDHSAVQAGLTTLAKKL